MAAYTPTELPEQYKNDDAVYLMFVQTYNFGQYGESYFNNFQRIYINKKGAIEEYANRVLELTAEGKIVMLKGRVIKANGDIIELDDDKIIISNISSGRKYNDDLYREAKMIYPDVQEGDVLDLVFDVEIEGYVYSETMFLAQELPVVYSRITIINNSILDLSAFPMNGLPDVKYLKTTTGPTFQTEQKNVKAIPDGYFNAIRPDMPKLIFNLWRPEENLTYDVVYSMDYQYEFYKYHAIKLFTEDLVRDGVIEREELTTTRFNAFLKVQKHLLEMIDENIEINLTNQEKIRSYYFNKKINRKIYKSLLENFLMEQNADYEKCMTNSLWSGQFDAKVVALDQLDATFFIVKDTAGRDHFLFMPTKTRKYQIDEIPFQYEGNSGVAWKGEEGTLKSVSKINLPEGSEKETQQVSNFQIILSAEAPHLAGGNRQDKFTGQYSSIVRGKKKTSLLEDLSISEDVLEPTKLGDTYPYQVEFRQTLEDTALVSDLDDDLKMLDLSSFFPTSIFFEEEKEENYTGYNLLPFKKTQQFRFFIQCDAPITLEEKAGKSLMENGVGTCSYSLSQMGDKSIKVVYEISLKKRILQTESDNKDYADLINFYHTMKGKKWVFSM